MGDGVQLQVNRSLVETSISDSNGIHLPLTIRVKIWARSYIELLLLLNRLVTFLSMPTVQINGQLVQERQHLRTIMYIYSWITAFITFTCQYTTRHTSTDSFLIKSRSSDVKRHLRLNLLLSMCYFKTIQFWAITRIKIRIKIVHYINERVHETLNIEDFLFSKR